MRKHNRISDKEKVRGEIQFMHEEIEMDKWVAQFDSDIAFFEEYYKDDMDWYKREPLPEGISLEVEELNE